jgi:hypothetical protein
MPRTDPAPQPDAPQPDPGQADALHAAYQRLAAQLPHIGYTMPGTLIHRHTRCASTGCHCRADPPQLHGPYWQWTTKTSGKTITRQLSPAQAQLYQQWINNNKQLHDILAQMRDIAAQATTLILQEQAAPAPTKV